MSRNGSSASAAAARGGRLFAALKDAVRGVPHDYTSGSIGRAITLLAIPMILEMLMQSVFAVADIYFVGRLGADAVAAVGLTESLLVLVLAVGLGLSMATTAMVARRIGEKDADSAARAAVQALIAGVAVSLPITVVGIAFAPELLRLMGASEAIVAVGAPYCAILFGTNATILFLFLINAIFRGAGDAALAMRALWIANLLNIALDPLLIFGWGPVPAMGVAGAAVATSLGRGIGIGYQLWVLLRGRGRFRILRRHLHLDLHLLPRLVKIAWPGMLQYLIGTASWMVLIRVLAAYGADALAGYTIAIRILIFALLPAWGLSNAVATLVGQNLGAGQPDRAERTVWLAGFANMGFLGVMALGLFGYGAEMMALFTDSVPVIAVGAACLRIVSYTYVLFALGLVTVQAFNGAGDTATPTWINLVSYWMLQIPLAYVLSGPLGMGPSGVFTAIAVSQAVLALAGTVLFRRGTWKHKMI